MHSEPPVLLLMGRTNCGLLKKLLRRRGQGISPQNVQSGNSMIFQLGSYCVVHVIQSMYIPHIACDLAPVNSM